MKIAYVMSRFPKLSETFVLNEIVAMKALGETVEIYPLWRGDSTTVHADAAALMEEVHFLPHLNMRMIVDNLSMIATRPLRYFGVLVRLASLNAASPRFLFGSLAFFPKLASFSRDMERRGIEHIHAHFASHPAAAAYGLNLLTGIPWSFTAHGSDLHRRQTMLREKVRSARFVATVSDYNKRFMAEHIDSEDIENVHVIRCGVDLARFRAAEKSSGFRILCVGTLHEVKGQRYLIQALAQLGEMDWECDLVGDGPDRSELESLASELGVSDRITFHGACTTDRVAELMSSAHALCAPSVPTADGRREGLPVVLIEAAATGLPLVSSNLSGIPEIVRNGVNGYLTEPRDVEAIARALSELGNSPSKVAEMGRESRAIAEAEFGQTLNAERLNALFRGRTEC